MIMKLKYLIRCACGLFPLWYIWYTTDYKIVKPLVQSMISEDIIRPVQNKERYVLIWTSHIEQPLSYMKEGRHTFIERYCPFSNCYLTWDRYFLGNIIEYDVIIFHGKEIAGRLPQMPKVRSSHQKYVFATMESSDYYPICDSRFDGFFNWTWTYKLNSDIFYVYFRIKDKVGNIIGPKEEMHWIKVEDMVPIDDNIKDKLVGKRKMAAWFVSNCNAPSGRDKFVEEVQKELHYYGLEVDIYGSCGSKKCPRGNMIDCLKMIEKDYYFYFSLENSFSEDYVTEKLLHALHNYAVPVVFGGANYTRFMPDGIYLNARKLGAKELVNQMVDIMFNKTKYYDFFKWHNYYSYHVVEESPDIDPYCGLCSKINDKSFSDISIYEDFKNWWNPIEACK